MTGLALQLDDDALDQFADAIAERVHLRLLGGSSPWMSATQAAEYIGSPISRIRQLTMADEIPVHRDGRRVLYHRDELDQWLHEQ